MTYKHEGTKVHVPTLYPRAPLSLATVWGWNIARTLDVVLLKKMREVGVEEARYQNNLKPNTICGGRGGVLHPWSNSNIPPSLVKTLLRARVWVLSEWEVDWLKEWKRGSDTSNCGFSHDFCFLGEP